MKTYLKTLFYVSLFRGLTLQKLIGNPTVRKLCESKPVGKLTGKKLICNPIKIKQNSNAF